MQSAKNSDEIDQRILELKQKIDYYVDIDEEKVFELAVLALDLSSQSASKVSQALGMWSFATGLTVKGEFQKALDYYYRAQRLYNDCGLEVQSARVALRQLQALAMLGKLKEARLLGEQIRELFIQNKCTKDLASTENNLSIIYNNLGLFKKAEEAHYNSIEQYRLINDNKGTLLVYINLAVLFDRQDRLDEAEQYLIRATNDANKLKELELEAGAKVNLASLYRRQGRLREALQLLTDARAYYEASSSSREAMARHGEAYVLYESNLLPEAEKIVTDACHIYETDNELNYVEFLTLLALILEGQEKYDEALKTFEQVKDFWENLNNTSQIDKVLLQIANIHLKTKQPTLSLQVLEKLAEKQTTTNILFSLIIKAGALLQLGQLKKAQKNLDQALVRSSSLDIPKLSYLTRYLYGKLAQLQNKPNLAKIHFLQALATAEATRGRLPIDSFKAAYMDDKKHLYKDLTILYLEQGDLLKAFEFTDKAKQKISSETTPIDLDIKGNNSMPDALKQKLNRARAELQWHSLKIEKDGSSSQRKAMLESEAKVEFIIREIERIHPYNSLEHSTNYSVNNIQASLNDSTLIVEYTILNNRLCAFLVSQTNVEYYTNIADINDINKETKLLRFYLSRMALGDEFTRIYGLDNLEETIRDRLSRLYTQVFSPFDLKSFNKLIIIPTESLGAIPFAALLNKREYLIDRYEISIVPSAAFFASVSSNKVDTSTLIALGIESESLPAIEQELTNIKTHFPTTTIMLGKNASINSFFKYSENASLIHLATHGSFRPDNPQYSALRLADGWVTARDLYNVKFPASLVVLSACSSGLQESHYSDEAFGLSRAFINAGATSLITSLWPIQDKESADFMDIFYAKLSEGSGASEALRSAQLEYRAIKTNPYYWAAFQSFGFAG